jgi:hypothetical protein
MLQSVAWRAYLADLRRDGITLVEPTPTPPPGWTYGDWIDRLGAERENTLEFVEEVHNFNRALREAFRRRDDESSQ